MRICNQVIMPFTHCTADCAFSVSTNLEDSINLKQKPDPFHLLVFSKVASDLARFIIIPLPGCCDAAQWVQMG